MHHYNFFFIFLFIKTYSIGFVMLDLNFVTQVHQILTIRKLFCCIDLHDILLSYQNNKILCFFY